MAPFGHIKKIYLKRQNIPLALTSGLTLTSVASSLPYSHLTNLETKETRAYEKKCYLQLFKQHFYYFPNFKFIPVFQHGKIPIF